MIESRRDGSRLSRIASQPIFSRPCGTGRPLKPNPGLASWAKVSRPSGTEFGKGGSHTPSLSPHSARNWGTPERRAAVKIHLSAAARETTGAGPAAEPSSVAAEEALSSEAVEAPNSVLSASDVPRSSSVGCTTAPADRPHSGSSAGYTTVAADRLHSAEGSSLAEVVGSQHPGAGSTAGPQAVLHSSCPLGATN